MNMIVILDNSPQGRGELTSVDCKGCGFRFYADTVSIRGLLYNKGILTCPSCRNTFQLKEIRLEGTARIRKLVPAQQGPTLVTDETEIPETDFELKKGTLPHQGISFTPARTKTTVTPDTKIPVPKPRRHFKGSVHTKDSYEPYDFESLVKCAKDLGIELDDGDIEWNPHDLEGMRKAEQEDSKWVMG